MYCLNCGKEIPDISKFCLYCGTELSVKNDNAIINVDGGK
jgi:rRNA maturation endonuclease Nob1